MKKETVKVDYPIYKVVGDGLFSLSELGEGRFIPAIIIEGKTDVSELIQLQKTTAPGDIESQWAAPKSFFAPKSLLLSLKCVKPIQFNYAIEFRLDKEFSLIDGIIHSHALYVISGKKGDKVSKSFNNGILIEIPDHGFDKRWNQILVDTLKDAYKKKGVAKKERQMIVNQHINTMRGVWKIRRENGD